MAEQDKEESVKAEVQAPDYGEVFATWDFYEHEAHERGRWWYIIAIVVVVLLLGYSYFDQNFLLAVIVALTIIIFVITELRGPGFHNFAITEDGLVAGPEFHPYKDLNNFFIIYQPPQVKALYFDPKSIFSPHIGVPLGDMNPNEIREILLNFLPEDLEKEEEPTSDFLGRLFKF
jgi:hypothetical protein